MSAPVPADRVIDLVDLHSGRRDLRLGLGEGDAERARIDPEQQVAAAHLLILVDQDLGDRAAHFGRDRDHVLLDIGIVGRDVAA